MSAYTGSPFLFERKLYLLLLFKGLHNLSVTGYRCLKSIRILFFTFQEIHFVEMLEFKADVF